MEAIARLESRHRTLLFLIGSADRSGEAGRNWKLARDRADSVARALWENGIPPYRLICCFTLSELALPVPTADGVLEPDNRRVEIWVR